MDAEFTLSPDPAPKILIIRRDNIGDLVCTAPLIAALRQRFPAAWLGALVNSYNAPVLEGNPDLDEMFVYTKAKHRSGNESLAAILWRRLRMMRRLRAMAIDDVIVATTSPQPRAVKLARWLKPKRVIGFGAVAGLDISLPVDTDARHEVEDVFRIAKIYGIDGVPPPCRVVAGAVSPAPALCVASETLTIGVHISARKPSQRWPAERFARTMHAIAAGGPVRFLLLWSPGDDDNPRHPGDDAKAREVMQGVGAGSLCIPGIPLARREAESRVCRDRGQVTVIARPTRTLPDLIAALAECRAVICADGGAMHLAAGLGLPVVCLFGNSGAARWHPWGVPYRLLQKPSLDVADIAVDEVVAAFNSLRDDIPEPSAASLP
ncbi:MAG: glycosyltransferase family 9 protein [Sulfuritalea sp.]|nr:glycosyltransferase family 9 protein [Sulfuritalea sp.]